MWESPGKTKQDRPAQLCMAVFTIKTCHPGVWILDKHIPSVIFCIWMLFWSFSIIFYSHREVAIAVEEQVVILFISLLSMLCIHLKLRTITLHACNLWSCFKLFQLQESVFLVSLLTLRALTWMSSTWNNETYNYMYVCTCLYTQA